MSATSNSRKKIADRLFYSSIGLLVIVLGGLGAVVTHNRIADIQSRLERRADITVNFLERVLPEHVSLLDAKAIREDIEATASDELQVVEIFDADGERIYVYERSGTSMSYDKKFERELYDEGKRVGKMSCYFAISSYVKSVQVKEFLRLLLLISSAGLVLGVGLYSVVRRFILNPIDKTVIFSESLAEGNYNRRIETVTDDEMGLLQDSLNTMADKLQDSVENLKASFYEAEGARLQALEASRLKSEFLAGISHEIRTPINAIIGFADILIETEDNEERKENLKTIKKSANILLENINNILDFSKIEAGKVNLDNASFLMEELIEEISPIINLRLHGKNVQFKYDVGKKLKESVVKGDRTRLRQVLLNILINAAKFTNMGFVELEIVEHGGSDNLLFKIKDTGIGIPKEYHDSIFSPFTQVDITHSHEHGGTGLGLAIAKRLVELMNGRIWVESALGEGSTFYFTAQFETE